VDSGVVLDPGVAGFGVAEDRAIDGDRKTGFVGDGAADRLANDNWGD
jgi:hypothetical protein